MNPQVNLAAIYIANFMGILLMIIFFGGNTWRLSEKNTDNRIVIGMIITVFFACLADPIAFTGDGKSGTAAFLMVYGGNLWLYISNVAISTQWVVLLNTHMNGKVPVQQKHFMFFFSGVGALILVLNCFFPLVFTVSAENVYQRGPLFWLYTGIQLLFIVDGLFIYYTARQRGGLLKLFPVWQFTIPIMMGILIQTFSYGVSTIWPCIAIAVCGVVTSLQNELMFRDRLTGTYNRFYLDLLKTRLTHVKRTCFTAMMLDMNDFKSINDRFGHSEGDLALIAATKILEREVGSLGTVMRYAGDEFVILLNTQDHLIVEICTEKIRKAFDYYNEHSGRDYELSLSIGCSSLNLQEQTLDDLLSEVDQKMYAEKQKYYSEESGHNRRKNK